MKIFGFVLLLVATFLFQIPIWIIESKLDIGFTLWEHVGWVASILLGVLFIINWERT